MEEGAALAAPFSVVSRPVPCLAPDAPAAQP